MQGVIKDGERKEKNRDTEQNEREREREGGREGGREGERVREREKSSIVGIREKNRHHNKPNYIN